MRRNSSTCTTFGTVRTRVLRALLALIAATAATAAPPLTAADGDLDPSFDGDGIFHAPDTGSFGSLLLKAPDGATVVWGSRRTTGDEWQIHWRRVTESGAGPLCTSSLFGNPFLTARGAAFDQNGRLLIVADVTFATQPQLGVYRFLYPACQPDTNFGVNGFASHLLTVPDHSAPHVVGVSTASWFEFPPGVVTHRILAAFTSRSDANLGSYDSFLVRLLNDGTLDSAFGGGDGIEPIVDGRRAAGFARALDGRYLLTTELRTSPSNLDTQVHKFDRDADPDLTFSDDGTVEIDLSLTGDSSDSLSILHAAPDGRVILAGVTDLDAQPEIFEEQGAVAVLTRDGDLDTSWSGDGWATFRPSGSFRSSFEASVLQGDGRLLLAGLSYDGEPLIQPEGTANSLGFVVRFARNGQIDNTFGSGGLVELDPNLVMNGLDSTNGVALADDGRIWVKGSEQTPIGGGETAQRPFVALLQNRYIFADGFERGSTGNW